jgi:mannose-1-phosphate guanylyltransferase
MNMSGAQMRTAVRLAETESPANRWGIILAGGDGTRLLSLLRKISGDDRPKQFTPILGGETLLRQTQERVLRLIKPCQMLLVLTRTHEQFYADQVSDWPLTSLVIQPQNRGTAPAILYSLMRLRQMDPQGVVALFPSDHYFANNDALTDHMDMAFISAEARPDMVVLLGIMPDSPEVEYGWIEPGPVISSPVYHAIRRVHRFWEKPSHTLASDLLARGCLWNSFIMVGHVQAFLDLIRCTLPCFYQRFQSISPLLFSAGETDAVERLYSVLHPINFSHDVLSARTDTLTVLCGTDLGWSDLGEPKRVLSVIKRRGVQTALGASPELMSAAAALRLREKTGRAETHG